MANEEELYLLRQGVKVWNKWREQNRQTVPDLSGAKLHRANLTTVNLENAKLTRADLCGADLTQANLLGADLDEAELRRANLYAADLRFADLSGAVLTQAELSLVNFSGANLSQTDLSRAILNGTEFTHAICQSTVFADVDLSDTQGLHTIQHSGPSTLGIDTLYNSRGNIPESFLHGCGIPENLVASIPSLMEGRKPRTSQNIIFGSPISDRKLQCDIFVIMPFADTFQPIYEDHIKPVSEELDCSIKRGDDFFGKTSIMTDIWSAINNAKLIIAECTGRNPNVFYELGIAHSLDKAVIMVTQNMDDIPFDIRHLRVIQYKYNPHGMVKFEGMLKKAISNLLEEQQIENIDI